MNRQQLAMRVRELTTEHHHAERSVDKWKEKRDRAQNHVNRIKNFLVGRTPRHRHEEEKARLELVKAENFMREADVRIQNREERLRHIERQRTRAQQELQHLQDNAQRMGGHAHARGHRR